MSLDDKYSDVTIARKVKELAGNEAFRIVFDRMREGYSLAIVQTDLNEREQREHYYRLYQASVDFEAHMMDAISAGEISQHQINVIVNRKLN